jgi:hypothetical protein
MYWGFEQLSTLPQDKWISSQKGGHLQFLTIQGWVYWQYRVKEALTVAKDLVLHSYVRASALLQT